MNRFFLYFLSVFFLLGCGKDNDDLTSTPLDGSWILQSHSCGDFSPGPQLENESYTWAISKVKETLAVESSYDGDFVCLPSPGSFTIKVSNDKIIIQSEAFDYSFLEGKLVVSNSPASGGPQFTFIMDE